MPISEELSSARVISLETYRRSGVPVRTPVWLVVEGGSLYVRTDPRSGKAKRMRRNPRVRLAPSDMRGNVKGAWVDGEAHFVQGDEATRVRGLFDKKYGAFGAILGVWHRIRGAPPPVIIAVGVGPAS